MKRTLLIISLVTMTVWLASGKTPTREVHPPSRPAGVWPGSNPPGDTAKLFFPGFISSGWNERDVALSPDGRELCFGVALGDIVTIMVTRLTETGEWSAPRIADFARQLKYAHFEPAYAPDGKRIYFLTTRPTGTEKDSPGWANQNIFYSEKDEHGKWSPPQDPGPPLNTEDAEYFPSFSRDGYLYFTRQPAKGGSPAIYRTRMTTAGFGPPSRLPDAVNGMGSVFNACVSPDGTYLVACVVPRDAPPRTPAQYQVFFKISPNRWTRGTPLSRHEAFQECPAVAASISPDGDFLFFATNHTARKWQNGPRTSAWLKARRHSVENGNSDIYWISTRFLAALHP